jgi:exopolysaccharide biosynthesis polyprenyl glycosylphosphotransferase
MAHRLFPQPQPPADLLRNDLRAPSLKRPFRGTGTSWARVICLVSLDASLFWAAWQASVSFGKPWAAHWNLQASPLSILPILGIEILMLLAGGFYKPGEYRRDYLGLAKTMTLATGLILIMAFFYAPQQLVSRSQLLIFWGVSLGLILLGRFLVEQSVEMTRTSGKFRYPVFLISDPEFLQQSVTVIEQENRYDIAGIVSARSLDRSEREATFAKLRRLGIVEAFVSWDAIKNRQFLYWHFQTAGITLHVLPIGLEPLFHGSNLNITGGLPSITFRPPMITGFDFWLKQILDFAGAAVLMLLLSPLLLVIASLIYLDSPGSVFYKQTRIGLHGKPFKAWKFRTMVANADKLQKQLESQNENKDGVLFKMKDDPRITRVGKVLRQYSLDELPQLFNVLLGEMSLVGPRPLPVRDVEKFSEHHFIRHEVLPGITGLWQVSGRSNIGNFEDVVNLDLSYIERWSLWLDLEILVRTVGVVLKKTGAY